MERERAGRAGCAWRSRQGVGNAAARRLLAAFGLPASVFGQTAAALEQVVTPAQAQALRSEPAATAGPARGHLAMAARQPTPRRPAHV